MQERSLKCAPFQKKDYQDQQTLINLQKNFLKVSVKENYT